VFTAAFQYMQSEKAGLASLVPATSSSSCLAHPWSKKVL